MRPSWGGRCAEGWSADIELAAGQMRFLDVPSAGLEEPLVETLDGLRPPQSGRVRFLGYDWQALKREFADALRGRIGYPLGPEEWLPGITVADNVILAERFHTGRPVDAIRREAVMLARSLGMPGLPASRPADTDAEDLRRAGFVSCFLGAPALVLLRGLPAGLRPAVFDLAFRARAAGAAVLVLNPRGSCPAFP
ncbi:MAG: hypothetical protein PVF40_00050 [Ectothiorhodospiraceae bacterium]